MIALGANELHMGPMAHLTAIDTSLTHPLFPGGPRQRAGERQPGRAQARDRAVGPEKQVEQSNPYQALFAHVHPLVIGAVDRAGLALHHALQGDPVVPHPGRGHRRADRPHPEHPLPLALVSHPVHRGAPAGLAVRELEPAVHDLLIDLKPDLRRDGAARRDRLQRDPQPQQRDPEHHRDARRPALLQTDKDWFYRTEERRWVPLNDNSCWRLVERIDGKIRKQMFHPA